MTSHNVVVDGLFAALAAFLLSGCLVPEKLTECSEDETCRQRYGPTHFCADDGICEPMSRDQFLAAPCDFDTQGPVFQDGTYNLGVILALNPEAQYWGLIEPIANAIRLATDDINSVRGVNGHKLGLIFCNTDGKNDKAKAAAQHLADIGVDAVVGPDFSSYAVEIVPEVLVPADVLTVTPSATAPSLSGIDDRDLVWRTVASDRIQTRALADLIENVAADFAGGAQSSPQTARPPMAMLTREKDSYAEGLQSGVINALSADFVEDIESFRYPNAGRDQGDDYTTIASKVADQKPRLVMVWGLAEVWDIVRLVDTFLQRDHGIDDAIYIVADGGKDTNKASDTAETFPDELTSLDGRVWGTAPRSLSAEDYDPYKFFKVRWRERHGDDADSHPFIANAYDAVYLISLAAAASGSFDGPALAEGMRRLTDPKAEAVVANQNDFQKAVTALSNGGTVDFRGASGPLDFDENGDPKTATISLWCYDGGAITESGDLLEVGSTEFTMHTCPPDRDRPAN